MWVLIILKNYEVGIDEIRKTINFSLNMYGETSVFVISVTDDMGNPVGPIHILNEDASSI